KKATASDPKSLTAHLGLGSFYQRQRRWAEAEAEYHRAIEIAPESATARTSLAALFLASGRKDQAEQSLKDTKQALPNDPNAYRLLGNLYLGQRETQKAFAEFAS